MTPLKFVESAEREVQALTDDGDQMHRRAAQGRRLVVHVHGWDATANPRPAAGGMTELQGGRRVALRVDGQGQDVVAHTLRTTAAAEQFAAEVEALLADRAAPIPGEPYRRPGRPALPPEQRRGATIPPVRCSPAQREKFDRLGGAEWLRKAIDRARG